MYSLEYNAPDIGIRTKGTDLIVVPRANVCAVICDIRQPTWLSPVEPIAEPCMLI